MSFKIIKNRIIYFEIIGFSILIVLFWIDEIFDIPHILFGAVTTPVNWIESIIESLVLLIIGIFVIGNTIRNIRKIKYLEGFLQVCAFC